MKNKITKFVSIITIMNVLVAVNVAYDVSLQNDMMYLCCVLGAQILPLLSLSATASPPAPSPDIFYGSTYAHSDPPL